MIKSVLVEFEDDDFAYKTGYMVEENQVILVDDFQKIWLYDVLPTLDPAVFRKNRLALQLGWLNDSDSEVEVVTKLYSFLTRSTAWELLTSFFPYPNPDIDFELTENERMR